MVWSKVGWDRTITTGVLGEHLREFRRDDVLDESASLALVLGSLPPRTTLSLSGVAKSRA